MLRDSFIKGSYLMEDDETGFVHHRKSMVRQWDGVWVHRRNHDPKHPQWWAQLAPMDGLAPSMIRTPKFLATPVAPATTGALLI